MPSVLCYGKRDISIGLQVAVSVMLLTLAVIALKQLTFMRQFDMGFDGEDVVVLRLGDKEARDHAITMRDEIARLAGVAAVSVSSGVPTHLGWKIQFRRRSGDRKEVSGFGLLADTHFLRLYDIASDVDPRTLPDGAVLLNHVSVERLGLVADQTEYIEGFPLQGFVRGLVDDFRFASLKEPVAPLLFVTGSDAYVQNAGYLHYLSIKVNPAYLSQTLEQVRRMYESVATMPFSYSMVEDDLRHMYAFEADLVRLLTGFSVIAFVLTCLGLLAVVGRWCAQLQREIAIRKVLGAGPAHLYWVLVSRLVGVVVLAYLLGTSMGLGIGHWGLQDYQATVDIGVSDVVLIGSMVTIALVGTSIYHLTRTILALPTVALAHE